MLSTSISKLAPRLVARNPGITLQSRRLSSSPPAAFALDLSLYMVCSFIGTSGVLCIVDQSRDITRLRQRIDTLETKYEDMRDELRKLKRS